MRWLVAICLATAGCYSPNVMVGATCDPATAVCPRDQACINTGNGFHCERDGTGEHPDGAPDDSKPPIDAPALDPLLDEDGDGVKNGVDNCPFTVNVDQHNEDADKFGDACDPCPILAAGIEADSDGDGVGDNCDPHPNTPGDHIYLFETFKNGISTGPGWDSFGAWAVPAAGDSVSISVDTGHANISYTMPTTGVETITTAMTLTGIGPSNNRGAGTIDEKGDAGSDGVACNLWADGNGVREIGVVHAGTAVAGATDINSMAFAWTLNTRYVMTETRKNTTYNCAATTGTASAVSPITNSVPQVGVWVSNATAKFDYLFVVTSPP